MRERQRGCKGAWAPWQGELESGHGEGDKFQGQRERKDFMVAAGSSAAYQGLPSRLTGGVNAGVGLSELSSARLAASRSRLPWPGGAPCHDRDADGGYDGCLLNVIHRGYMHEQLKARKACYRQEAFVSS